MKTKAVVLIITDRYRTRSRHKESYVAPTRIVRDIERVEGYDWGTISEWYPDMKARWAEGLDWRLYKGTVKYKGVDLPVWGWSFGDGDRLPIFWAGDYHRYPYNYGSDHQAAWQWLHNGDVYDKDGSLICWMAPNQQWAYQKCVDRFGWESVCEWLGDDLADMRRVYAEGVL